MKFENLKILDLSYNEISDIKILEKIKFKNLEKLDLSKNNLYYSGNMNMNQIMNYGNVYMNPNKKKHYAYIDSLLPFGENIIFINILFSLSSNVIYIQTTKNTKFCDLIKRFCLLADILYRGPRFIFALKYIHRMIIELWPNLI